MLKKKEFPTEKQGLHPRNPHRERYDFGALVQSCPELAAFVIQNPYQDTSIDFFNPDAVKMLNRALLKHFYNIESWDIPPGYLCPPMPGRADYIHHAADLLALVEWRYNSPWREDPLPGYRPRSKLHLPHHRK